MKIWTKFNFLRNGNRLFDFGIDHYLKIIVTRTVVTHISFLYHFYSTPNIQITNNLTNKWTNDFYSSTGACFLTFLQCFKIVCSFSASTVNYTFAQSRFFVVPEFELISRLGHVWKTKGRQFTDITYTKKNISNFNILLPKSTFSTLTSSSICHQSKYCKYGNN